MKRTIAIALLLAACRETPEPTAPAPGHVMRPESIVETFGKRMKSNSTLAPHDVAVTSIRQLYGELADPQLLARWIADPSHSPGRAVSSPWPDHIEILSVSPAGDEVQVAGVIVEMTSSGEAGRRPVRLTLKRDGDSWRITSFAQEQDATSDTPTTDTPPTTTAPANEDATAAVTVIRDYYAAISARDYRRAYASWGASGPPNQTYEQFMDGFRDTKSVRVETGTPSDIEGAAGSRFIEIPVTITATTSAGMTQRFEGKYTLRRSVIEGGDPSWRIDGASIRRAP